MWRFRDKNGNQKQAAAAVVVPAVELNTPTTTITNAATLQAIVAWTNETYKTVAGLHTGTDGKLYATVAGRYLLNAALIWNAAPTNSAIQFRKNGVTNLGGSGFDSSAGGGTPEAESTIVVNLAVGDYVECLAAQNSATGALGLTAGSRFSMIYLDGAVDRPVAYPASLVGQEMAYAELTAPVTSTVVAEAVGVTVITAPVFTADGVSSYDVEFYSPRISAGGSGATYCTLWMDGVDLGQMVQANSVGASGVDIPGPRAVRKVTPAAGAHTFVVKTHSAGAAGQIGAGVGGAGALLPAFIRVKKAS